MHQAFTLDISKCTGCQACEVACAVENELAPGTSWRSVDTFNPRHLSGFPVFHLSLACNHCLDPPCLVHCPALAYSKDPLSGAVRVDQALCIGCRYCTWACPYDAPRFDPAAGVVTKCTFCDHRLREGLRPACVEQCPTGALQTADLDAAPGSAWSLGFPQSDADPAIRFIAPAGARGGPEMSTQAAALPSLAASRDEPKVSLGKEWPLVVFTLATALLVGLVAAPGVGSRLSAVVFVAGAVAGAGFSTMHLGRKLRAHRAVLNWRRSWLSREIILFTMFAVFSTVHLATDRAGPVTGWAAIVAGFAALFAMDRVYGVTRTRGLWRHSAQALLTGALVFGIAAGSEVVAFGVGALKGVLYAYRKRDGARLWLGVLRVGVGLVVPAVVWLVGGPGLVVGAAMVAAGEIVDRCEFYMELDVPTPRKQLAADLAALLSRPVAS